MSSMPGVTIAGFAGAGAAGAAGFGAGAAGAAGAAGFTSALGAGAAGAAGAAAGAAGFGGSSGLRSFNRSGLYRSGCRGGRSSCRSGRLCRSSGGGSSSGLCSRSCGFRRLLALDKLDLQLAFASRSGLFLLIRSIGSFGGRRLFQVLVAGFGLLAFAFGGRFDLLVVRGIHLGHMSTDSHARVAKQLHHDIDLDAVGFSPIYWFNLIFISHE